MSEPTIADVNPNTKGTSTGSSSIQATDSSQSHGAFPSPVQTETYYGKTVADVGLGVRRSPPGGSVDVGRALRSYQIIKSIGSGGMGDIFLARNASTGGWCALKRLKKELAGDPQAIARFMTEAQTAAALSHIHIVALHHKDEDEDGPFAVMEYVPGPKSNEFCGPSNPLDGQLPNPPLDLANYIKQHGPLKLERVVELGGKLCSALTHAHNKGIVHRDVKPANILLNENLEPKLTDFGLAKRVNQAAAEHDGNTLGGAQLLTPYYGAPEQEQDSSKADHRADIYSLAATMWYTLTGKNPREFRESAVPAPLRAALIKAMKVDREQRFQSAAEFERALRRSIASSPSTSRISEQVTVPGLCCSCGHVNPIDPKNPHGRRYCERCGDPLVDYCFACVAENPSSAIYCSSCGADLAKLLCETTDGFKAKQDHVQEYLAASRFDEAIQLLQELKALEHPRLAPFAKWAAAALPDALGLRSTAEAERDEKVASAQRRIAACDFDGAVTILMEIPSSLRTLETQSLLESGQELSKEKNTLASEIRLQIKSGIDEGLRKKLLRFGQLAPSDAGVSVLINKLDDRTLRAERHAWRTAANVDQMDSYRAYLLAWPDAMHTEEAKRRLSPMLRSLLLAEPSNRKLRQEYLATRSETMKANDEESARYGITMIFTLWGAFVGALGGAFLGAISFPACIIGGLIGGAGIALYLSKRK